MKVRAIYILHCGLMALVDSSPITTRDPDKPYARRSPNQIHVGGTEEHKKVCEVSVHRQRDVDLILCTSDKSTQLEKWNIAHSCIQTYTYNSHGDISLPSGCALILDNEGKHAQETPSTKECVDGERTGELGFHEVFFVQEVIKLPHGHVNTGCSTYYKD